MCVEVQDCFKLQFLVHWKYVFKNVSGMILIEDHKSDAISFYLCKNFCPGNETAVRLSYLFKGFYVLLTQCGLVVPYGDMELGQHWLR